MPRGRRIPRLRQITFIIGAAVTAEVLCEEGSGKTEEERIAAALRARVAQLGQRAGFQQVEDAEPLPSLGQDVR